jgi:hypothetical protein
LSRLDGSARGRLSAADFVRGPLFFAWTGDYTACAGWVLVFGVDRFELTARLARLELPLHLGSATPAEARQELARLDA